MRAAVAGLLFACMPAMAQVELEAFLKKDAFTNITISPTGAYYAATVPSEDRTGLLIISRTTNKPTGGVNLGKNRHVGNFSWVGPDRIVFDVYEKIGMLDQPQSYGELFSVDAKSGFSELLVGQRVIVNSLSGRGNIKKEEKIFAKMIDDLPADDQWVVITARPVGGDLNNRAELLDVYSGKRKLIVRAPVDNASFYTDSTGVVRFAKGHRADNFSQLYLRSGNEGEWELINDEATTGRMETPIGFSSDNKIAYLQSDQKVGTDSIVSLDPATKVRTEVMRDPKSDPSLIIYSYDAGATPMGAWFLEGIPRTAFFDKTSREARLQRSLEAAFKGQTVYVTSTTKDGSLAIVQTESAGNPGDFFLFDTVAKTAKHLFSGRREIDPANSAEVRPIDLKSRDGLDLHGYLTLPPGSSGKNLPTVVMVHGGPFGIFDTWTFDDDAQLLAKAGYAVLQVNFRGSGNFGRSFELAGAREYGGKMQDDVTDATRWAIAQGISDAGRICIYGGSYGAFAALTGVAKEPDLYRCAVGYVGLYDLPMKVADAAGALDSRSAATEAKEWLGEGAMLASASPTNLAGSIKAPVLIVAGEEDETTPIAQSKKMEKAIRSAGGKVETMYVAHEGHGFYNEPNRRAYYVKLLEFLATHLGGAKAAGAKQGK
jgi:dipeptidyl aminopeptidase/acylaminoacyl peptidase